MTRIDHEKANRKRRNRPPQRIRKGDGQTALAQFVRRHRLACFGCGAAQAEWAKTGISARGPWCICVPCTTSPKPSG